MPVVTTLEQLERLRHARAPVFPGRSVQLDIAGLDDGQRLEWEGRLNRSYSACGCKSGAVALTVFLVAWIAAVVVGPVTVSLTSAVALAVGILAASLAGKLAGIAVGRLGLRRSIHRLRRLLPPESGAS